MAEKKISARDLVKTLGKTFQESVILASDVEEVTVIPTGLMSLDNGVFVIGGIPRGKITEIYGIESGGKTTLMMHAIANVLKTNPDALIGWIDAEDSWTKEWAEKFGIDHDRVVVIKPATGEDAFEQICTLIGLVDVVVVDSLPSLQPKALLEKEPDKNQKVGAQAQMLTLGCGQVKNGMKTSAGTRTVPLRKSKTAIVFINQVRENMDAGPYGDPHITPGGRRVKHECSIRLEAHKSSVSQEKDSSGNPIGQKIRVKAMKNKLAPPLRQTYLWVYFTGKVEDDIKGIIELTKKSGRVNQRGGYYDIVNVETGEITETIQGQNKLQDYFRDNPSFLAEVLEDKTPLSASESESFIEDDEFGVSPALEDSIRSLTNS